MGYFLFYGIFLNLTLPYQTVSPFIFANLPGYKGNFTDHYMNYS